MRNVNFGYGELLFREDIDVQVQHHSQIKISTDLPFCKTWVLMWP